MKRVICLVFPVLFLYACEVQKPLYSWGKYERDSYNYLKNNDEVSTQEIIKTYRQIIENQTGTREVPPPGVCADYGFVLMQANKVEEGKAMFQKEVLLYPESKVFIDRILKMMENEE